MAAPAMGLSLKQETGNLFIAINRIKVRKGCGAGLEETFGRGHGIDAMPGFLGFELLKRVWRAHESEEDEYLAVSRWESQEAFMRWTQSDPFRRAHAGPRPEGILSSEPAGFEVVVAREPAGPKR